MVIDLNSASRWSGRRPSASPTAWPCPAATSSSAPPSGPLALLPVRPPCARPPSRSRSAAARAAAYAVLGRRCEPSRPSSWTTRRWSTRPPSPRWPTTTPVRPLFVVAAKVGSTRLIDNADAVLRPGDPSRSLTPRPPAARADGDGSRRGGRRALRDLARRLRRAAARSWSTEARQASDRELAKQIGQLRRPTRSAWLVNLLARRGRRTRSRRCWTWARELGDAQQRGSGRRPAPAVQAAPDGGRRAGQTGRASSVGTTATSRRTAPSRRSPRPCRPRSVNAEVAELVRRGRLTQATTYGGFGPSDLTAALAASMPTAAPRPTAADRLAAPHAVPETDNSQAAEEPSPRRSRRRTGSGASRPTGGSRGPGRGGRGAGRAAAGGGGLGGGDHPGRRAGGQGRHLAVAAAGDRGGRAGGPRAGAGLRRKRQTELRQAAVAAEKRAAAAAAEAG